MDKAEKLQLKIKNLSILISKIQNWKLIHEFELEKVINQFEKIPREEVSIFYRDYFTNNLVEELIRIGMVYENNTNILCNIISSLGNMTFRYKLEITDNIYDFFIRYKKHKKVNYYISIFMFNFPQFKICEDKWEYIISIPNIAPVKKSKDNFRIIVKRLITNNEKIPDKYKKEMTKLLKSFLESDNMSEYSKNEYNSLIEDLNLR
jgi:hypothetical protein